MLVLDLRRHDQRWVSEALGDRWLGFEDDELAGLMRNAGLTHVRVSVGASRPRDPFTVLIASGLTADSKARARTSKSHVTHN